MKSVCVLLVLAACGGGGGGTTGLDHWLPPLPTPDGSAPTVHAGVITSAAELLPGDARSALVGDYFIKNARASFAIQGPSRFLGVVPWGGNLVDAVALDADGQPLTDDHFGELSLFYVLGRTCAHDRVDVLLDGSGGGPAVIRARGLARANDYLNIKGIGLLNVMDEQDPLTDDQVACATTYTLEPDSKVLHVQWTLYNGGTLDVDGPLAALSDVGGQIQTFVPKTGFSRASLDTLLSSAEPNPVPYAVYQGPGVAYGLVPEASSGNSVISIAGISVVLYGTDTFLDLLDASKFYLHLSHQQGVTHSMDFVVARDGGEIDAFTRARDATATTAVSGHVTGLTGKSVRVGVFADANSNGALDDDDPVVTTFDTQADGSYAGVLPPGKYLLRAGLRETTRGPAVAITVADSALTTDLTVPTPARYDFTITDAATGEPIPCKLTVVGKSPVPVDARVEDDSDASPVAIQIAHAMYGTTVPLAAGDPVDEPLELPPGGPYKIFVSRGPEWSLGQIVVNPTAGGSDTITLSLAREVDTSGYLATEFHQHAVGSLDSVVSYRERLATLLAEGIEFFASTDHDFLSDYEPVIAAAGVGDKIDAVVGVEASPFAYGHTMAYPLTTVADDPTGGNVDWAGGGEFALLPREMWQAYRDRGARIIQVNHVRKIGHVSAFQAYFDVAGVTFDYASHTFGGSAATQPVPADWLRLPDAAAVFDDHFDAFEAWNSVEPGDSNGDGWREQISLDSLLRDFMELMSFGKVCTPMADSDVHTLEFATTGMPRTMIRVPDDTPGPTGGATQEAMWGALDGTLPRDVIVTDGPMITVQIDGQPAIGRVVTVAGGQLQITIEVQSADWIDLDTVEIFINTAFGPRVRDAATAIPPTLCFTARSNLPAGDLCALAPLGGARPLTVTLEPVVTGGQRHVATVTFTLPVADLPHPTGATGQDAWLMVRASGQRAVFPVVLTGLEGDATIDTLVSGTPTEIDALLRQNGVPATAMAAPTLLDVDGGGWRAPFAP